MELSEDEIRNDVIYQLGALQAFAAAHRTKVTHICPHGKLGNMVIVRPTYARAFVNAVKAVDHSIIIYTQPGETAKAAQSAGIPIALVGNIDRSYEDDGTLTPRSIEGAVLHDPKAIAERAIRLIEDGVLISRGGVKLHNRPDTILLHSDGVNGLEIARAVHDKIENSGIVIRSYAKSRS